MMVATIRVDSDDLWDLSTQLSAIADDLHSHPFINVGDMPGCGSSLVANAAKSANDHFELRALLIETELRDAAAMVRNVASAVEANERMLASPGSNPGLHGWPVVS